MLNIKKIIINEVEKDVLEEAFRDYSLRRGSMIEFSSKSVYDKIDNKYFFANENNKYFLATRIRNSIENLLPRLIIKINKTDFSIITFRYGLISVIYIFFLIVMTLISIFFLFNYDNTTVILFFLLLIFVQICLTVLEYKLSLLAIKKIVFFEKQK